ncbi:hypothetical protein [Xanthomonas phage DES1]|nr:hypothetical protein [Xanthomonas phage DES1]
MDFLLLGGALAFFIAGGLNKHMQGTNSIGLGAALATLSFII